MRKLLFCVTTVIFVIIITFDSAVVTNNITFTYTQLIPITDIICFVTFLHLLELVIITVYYCVFKCIDVIAVVVVAVNDDGWVKGKNKLIVVAVKNFIETTLQLTHHDQQTHSFISLRKERGHHIHLT